MPSAENGPSGVEALATRVRQLLWVVLDSVPAELVEWSLMLVRLLHAADTFPRGGLYDGYYAAQAAMRYEGCWLPLLSRAAAGAARRGKPPPPLVPPLDVAMAWLLHRCTEPASYGPDCEALVGMALDPPPGQAFRFAGARSYTHNDTPLQRAAWASREAWDAEYAVVSEGSSGGGRKGGRGSEGEGKASGQAGDAAGGGGAGGGQGTLRNGTTSDGAGGGSKRLRAQFWPPAPPGSQWDLSGQWPSPQAPQAHERTGTVTAAVAAGLGGGTAGAGAVRGRMAARLSGRMSELCPLLHSLLRPAYLDPDVLAQAVQRYCRFLMLQAMHPHVPCVPTTDIALMWVAHTAVPSAYRATCWRLLGGTAMVAPGPGALRLDDGGAAFEETRRLYEHHFGEVYDPPLTRAVPLSTPHPLLSSPLAPFLPAFDAAAPDAVTPAAVQALRAAAAAAAAAAGGGAGGFAQSKAGPGQGPAPGTAMQPATADLGGAAATTGSGAAQHPQRPALTPASAGAEAAAALPPGGQRCGAHALYLAYLLRRGAGRRGRNLLGLVLGQAHRRRVAVRYVADKAARFRDFKHLPDSDCHPYWRKLRLRTVDPASVTAADGVATSALPDGSDLYGARQMDEEALYGSDGGSDNDGSDADSDAGGEAAAGATAKRGTSGGGDGGGRPNRRRRASWEDDGGFDAAMPAQAKDGPGVRQKEKKQGNARRRSARPLAAATAAAGPGSMVPPTRIALIMPLTALRGPFVRSHSRGSSGSGLGSNAEGVGYSGGGDGGGGGGGGVSGRSSGAGTPPAGHSERLSRTVPSEVASSSYSQPLISRRFPVAETESCAVQPSAPQLSLAGAANLSPGAEGSGTAAANDRNPGLAAAAAAAREPFLQPGAAAAKGKPPLHPGPPGPPLTHNVADMATVQATAAAAEPPAVAGGTEADTELPLSPLGDGQAPQRLFSEGRAEWAFHNPHFVERLAGVSRTTGDDPLSPIALTPPPASAIWLSAAAAAANYSPDTPETATTVSTITATAAAASTVSPADATSRMTAATATTRGGVWAVGTDRSLMAAAAAAAAAARSAVSTIPSLRDSGEAAAPGPTVGPRGAGATVVGGTWATRVNQAALTSGGGGGGRHGSRRGSYFHSGPASSATGTSYYSLPASRGSSLDGVGAAGGGADVAATAAASSGGGGSGAPSLQASQSGSEGAETGSGFFTPLASSMGEPSVFLSTTQPLNTIAGGGAAAANAAAAASGSGPPSGRISAPSPSRLSRVSSATDIASAATVVATAVANLRHVPAAGAASPVGSASSASHAKVASPAKNTGLHPSVNIRVPGLPNGTARVPGLPPRPQPPSFSTSPAASVGAVSGLASAGGGSRRASGGYSRADAAYFSGMGGLAGLAGRGDEEPVFGGSLRERYTGSALGSARSSFTDERNGRRRMYGDHRQPGSGNSSGVESAGGGGGGGRGTDTGGNSPALSNQGSFRSAGSRGSDTG